MAGVIYTIGETVLDIIFRDHQPVSAIPGGSMLNTAVSLGRAGLKVEFISEYGNDQCGSIIDAFLKENHVGTRFIRRYDDGKTALALAFLDRKHNASYSFHTSYPRIRMKDPLPMTEKGEIKMKLSSYGCKNIIITRNSKGVIAWFGDRRIEVKTPPVKPLVSTIGAGDSFNAGII